MIGLAKVRLFQKRGEPFEQCSNLSLIEHASGDEQLARAIRRQRGVGFEQALDLVAGDVSIDAASDDTVDADIDAGVGVASAAVERTSVVPVAVQGCVGSFAHGGGDDLRRRKRRLTGSSGGFARNQIPRSSRNLLRGIR
jgi:hypothetical protein